MTTRHCPDCGADISHRHGNSPRCAECQHVRDTELRHERHLRNKTADPNYLPKAAADKQAWYWRKKQTGAKLYLPHFLQCPRCRRYCRTVAKRCSSCGHTLEAARVVIGRRQQPERGRIAMREG